MKAIVDGSNIALTIDLAVDGEIIAAQSVFYKLLDGNNSEIISLTESQSFVPGDVSVSVTIPGSFNCLDYGSAEPSSRMLIIAAHLEAGDFIYIKETYLILPVIQLSFMQRSYQSFQDAEVIAYSMPNLDMWNSSDEFQKVTALVESFNRIGRLRFKVLLDDGYTSVQITGLNTLEPAYIATLPSQFLSALKRAQVVEANSILGGDSISEKREMGLMSETVGESSTMWRPGKPLPSSVSRRALTELMGYVYYGASVGRS